MVYLATVDEFISARLTKAGITNSTIADLAISVSEAVTNAIIHGNRNDVAKKVTVRIELNQTRVRIFVKDQGHGFDPDVIPNPTDKENLLKRVGRGIFIVRSLVDSVEFSFSDQGTELILKKNLARE